MFIDFSRKIINGYFEIGIYGVVRVEVGCSELNIIRDVKKRR